MCVCVCAHLHTIQRTHLPSSYTLFPSIPSLYFSLFRFPISLFYSILFHSILPCRCCHCSYCYTTTTTTTSITTTTRRYYSLPLFIAFPLSASSFPFFIMILPIRVITPVNQSISLSSLSSSKFHEAQTKGQRTKQETRNKRGHGNALRLQHAANSLDCPPPSPPPVFHYITLPLSLPLSLCV